MQSRQTRCLQCCLWRMATSVCEVPAYVAEAPSEVDALMRTAKKRRRKELLASKWYCQYCKHYTEREVEGVPVLKCSKCVAVEPIV